MVEEKYKDVDCPFCIKCSRFMVKYIGDVKILLNKKEDLIYLVRLGRIYKCPECGFKVVYKWIDESFVITKDIFDMWTEIHPYWYIFLEEHTHYKNGRPSPPSIN